MLIQEEIKYLDTNVPSIAYELESLIAVLSGEEKEIAVKALKEIQMLNGELKKEKRQMKEVTSFFSTWIEGLDKIIKTPVYLEDNEQVQVRYKALHNSMRNLIDSCRKKIQDIEFPAINR